MSKGVFVTGIGTEVGKTVVSALLVEALKADYWKPVQSGDLHFTDTHKIEQWAPSAGSIFPERFRLNTPASPHASAKLDRVEISLSAFELPDTQNFLVVEGAGGLWVPLSDQASMLDLIQELDLPVVLVSRHYLGSINHTLLSLEALQRRNIPVAALIWNGQETPETERIIEHFSGSRALLRLEEQEDISAASLQQAAAIHRDTLIDWKDELIRAR